MLKRPLSLVALFLSVSATLPCLAATKHDRELFNAVGFDNPFNLLALYADADIMCPFRRDKGALYGALDELDPKFWDGVRTDQWKGKKRRATGRLHALIWSNQKFSNVRAACDIAKEEFPDLFYTGLFK